MRRRPPPAAVPLAPWTPLLALLALLAAGPCGAHPHSEARLAPTEPPGAVSATNSTLTMALGAPCERPCHAHWQIKEKHSSEWKSFHFARTEEVVFRDLKEATAYEVRAPLQFDPNLPLNENVSVAEISTCPRHPPIVYNFYVNKRGSDFLMVSWHSEDDCASDGYYLWWTAYEGAYIEDVYWSSTVNLSSRCHPNATLITNLTAIKCEGASERYCYSVTDVLPRTRYAFQMQKVNWRGECSPARRIKTATAVGLRRGIAVGEWSLLFVCIGVLVCAVPGLFLYKRRVAERMTTRASASFRRGQRREDAAEEGDEGGADRYLTAEAAARVQLAAGTPPPGARDGGLRDAAAGAAKPTGREQLND